MELLRRFEVIDNLNEQLQQLEWNDKLAVAVSSVQAQEEKQSLKSGYYCFKSPNHIHEYSLKILASKDFPYLTELNNLIQMACDTGLIMKWLKNYRTKLIFEIKPLYEYTEVTVDKFTYFIIIGLILNLLASVVGLIERIVYEKVFVENVGRNSFWRYIEMVINPHRYFFFGNFITVIKTNRIKDLSKRQNSKVRSVRFEESN